jgi:hypothetical protein
MTIGPYTTTRPSPLFWVGCKFDIKYNLNFKKIISYEIETFIYIYIYMFL